ncbi:hypothetical protein CQ047_14240 [Microbacterium sp. MYb72]|uniref:hypothetical protein n=1 Tax=Microbacterium sp. MYb72 TaxID=1848693 RepID=UPI000CFB13C6|nr:hypothetical protein [Microbacterium sp. MYb72]PRB07121.1 hypothetical protein CQ047_14240 [Microbacterium sp. MYb72]
MSEPLQPPVPPHGQPSPQPQSAPLPPQPSAQPQSAPHQPQSAPHPPQPYGGPQGHPPETAPYQRVGHPVGAPHPGQFPTSGPAGPPSPPTSSGALGRTAFIIALVGLVVGTLSTIAYPLASSLLDYSTPISMGVLSALIGVITLAAAGVALALGLAALRRPGPRVLAGIAIGIAAAELFGTVVSWLSTLVYSFI